MKDAPLVSVVIPAHNASRWIAETLESVLAQDYTDFEVIVIDDGSTDNTAQVVAGYGERVRCIRKKQGGSSSARNFGIRAALGKYIAFVDADDLWVREKLRLQIDLLYKSGLAWVYSDALMLNESGKILCKLSDRSRQRHGDILEPLILGNFIPSPTPIVHRTVFEHVGYFDDTRFGEDWDMWLRISAHYPIGLVPKPLAYYRVHETSKSASADPRDIVEEDLFIVRTALAREPARLTHLKNIALANCYVRGGELYASKRNFFAARKMFEKAIRISPTHWQAYVYWVGCSLGDKTSLALMRLRHWLLYERHSGKMQLR